MDLGGTGGKPRRAASHLPHESIEDHGVAVSEPAQLGEDRVPFVLKPDLLPFQDLDPLEDSCQMTQACFGFEGHVSAHNFPIVGKHIGLAGEPPGKNTPPAFRITGPHANRR